MFLSALLRRLSSSTQRRPLRALRRPQRASVMVEQLEDRRLLSVLTVINNADHGPGSLRAALAAAQDGDAIRFANSLHNKTISLTTGELDVNRSVAIQGLGANTLSVSGNDASRVFNIAGGVAAAVSDLTISHGQSSGLLAPGMGGGGGVLNQAGAQLTLNRDTFTGNKAVGSVGFTVVGGALLNMGTATVVSCQFSSNQAVGGGAGDALGGSAGGAIDNFGSPDGPANLTVTNSTFTGNTAWAASGTFFGIGGAVDSNGGLNSFDPNQAQVSSAVLTNCAFVNNLASGDTGAIGNAGAIDVLGEKTTVTVNNCLISGNRSIGGGGDLSQGVAGGILNGGGGILNVLDSAIVGNVAYGGDNGDPTNPFASGAFGGGIENNYGGNDGRGVLNLSNSLIANNVAQGGAEAAGPGGIGVGGGISNSPLSSMLMTNCVVADNSAIGGQGGPGSFTGQQQAGIGFGGGIDVSAGASASIINSTITGNQAIGGAGGNGNNGNNGYGGGIGVAWDPFVSPGAPNSQVTVTNSVVNHNQARGGRGGAGANGGDGLGGGLYVSASGSATLITVSITHNDADGGEEGAAGHDDHGYGGGVARNVASVFSIDLFTLIKHNHASTRGDDIDVEV